MFRGFRDLKLVPEVLTVIDGYKKLRSGSMTVTLKIAVAPIPITSNPDCYSFDLAHCAHQRENLRDNMKSIAPYITFLLTLEYHVSILN